MNFPRIYGENSDLILFLEFINSKKQNNDESLQPLSYIQNKFNQVH